MQKEPHKFMKSLEVKFHEALGQLSVADADRAHEIRKSKSLEQALGFAEQINRGASVKNNGAGDNHETWAPAKEESDPIEESLARTLGIPKSSAHNVLFDETAPRADADFWNRIEKDNFRG